MQNLQTLLNLIQQSRETYAAVFLAVSRYLVPALGAWLLLHCARPLISFRREPEIWAWLKFTDGTQVAVTHWENVIGRAKSSDITVALSTVSRNHAVLTRYDDGSWTITDASSKTGTWVNGERVDIRAIGEGDVISIGGVDMERQPITKRQEQLQSQLRTGGSSGWSGLLGLLILTLLQAVMLTGFLLNGPEEEFGAYFLGFGAVAVCQWGLFFFYLAIRRRSFEVETLAFFLCTLGAAAIATVKPGELGKQSAAMVLGVLMFLLIGWSLRDLERAKRFRYLAVLAGVGFLVVTLLFGKEYYGAKNWLVIGNLSLQPSELSKVCFVYAGASTMDRIMNKRNLILFIAYSVVICGLLALMNDFGTAIIFFVAFLVIAFLRSGDVATIALACAGTGFAGVLALRFKPYALKRFSAWGHVWENALTTGYSQTRAMMCIASGGLFGLGAGKGWLHNVGAADTDLVFALVSEEWGLILAVTLVAAIAVLAVFVVRSAPVGRSCFYTIGACAAVTILVTQAILNVFGTVDILPLTGVTFPFVSNGGSSMLCVWGLLAFVKAADTRQNASFAIRLPGRKGA